MQGPVEKRDDNGRGYLARSEADLASQHASVMDAKAQVRTAQTDISKASIRSPIDGVVLVRSVEPGQTVAASFQVATLFTVAQDLREMQLKVLVDEADVGTARVGQDATFSVDAYPIVDSTLRCSACPMDPRQRTTWFPIRPCSRSRMTI